MPVETSSADLAASICEVPRPVIFLDTAAFLDILRVPFRNKLQPDILNVAVDFVEDAIASPRRIWLTSTMNVVQEYRANRDVVAQELTAHIDNLTQSVARLARIAGVVIPEKRVHQLEWLDETLQERVAGVVDRLVACTKVFRGTPECIARARNRVWAALPPASKANQEFKDCEIFEEFLELAHTLRRSNFDQPIIFVTPNANDYGPAPKGHDQIAADLDAHKSKYAGNAAWARAMMSVNPD